MQKRIFDIVISFIGLSILWPILVILIVISAIDTRSTGIFVHQRIGRKSKTIKIFKIRTIGIKSKKISPFSRWVRKHKLDELPQLLNVLLGQMSMVGPRPDIPGYYDELKGEARKILQLRPGITSPAAIKYYDENVLLSKAQDALDYNDNTIFPDKVKMNIFYFDNNTIFGDVKILFYTLIRVIGRNIKTHGNT